MREGEVRQTGAKSKAIKYFCTKVMMSVPVCMMGQVLVEMHTIENSGNENHLRFMVYSQGEPNQDAKSRRFISLGQKDT